MIKFQEAPVRDGQILHVLREWSMVLVALIFVALYGLALLGKLRPLADASVVSRLEPIVFLTLGYCFGRLPGQQNEHTLKEAMSRQVQKADAAQQAKETALQSREALDEKVKNARTVLTASSATSDTPLANCSAGEAQQRVSLATALNILNS